MTHTLAILEVQHATYSLIRLRLSEAGYGHAILADGTLDMTGIALRLQEEAEQPWVRDNEVTFDMTLLVGEDTVGTVTPEIVAGWTDQECQAVEIYCGAVHLHASDNDDIPIPPVPACLIACGARQR